MTMWEGLFLAFVYVMPTVLAFLLRSRYRRRIVAVDLLTGWTLLGWVVALVLAYRWRGRDPWFMPTSPYT